MELPDDPVEARRAFRRMQERAIRAEARVLQAQLADLGVLELRTFVF